MPASICPGTCISLNPSELLPGQPPLYLDGSGWMNGNRSECCPAWLIPVLPKPPEKKGKDTKEMDGTKKTGRKKVTSSSFPHSSSPDPRPLNEGRTAQADAHDHV